MEKISDIYMSFLLMPEALLATVGVGVVLVPLWLSVFLFALTKRRSWFSHVNIWAGSLVYGAFVFGVLSFLQPVEGMFAIFTADGEFPLSGRFGHLIAGTSLWFGVLRVGALFLLGTVIIVPKRMSKLTTVSWKLLVFGFMTSIVVVKSIIVGLRHIYGFKPNHRIRDRYESDGATKFVVRDGLLGERPIGNNTKMSMSIPEERYSSMPLSSSSMEVSGNKGKESSSSVSTNPIYDAENGQSQPIVRHNKILAESPYYGDAESDLADELTTEKSSGTVCVQSHASDLGVMWEKPSTKMLVAAKEGGISKGEMEETAETIRRTLDEYGVEVEVGQIKPGPTVTMYGLIPGWVRRQKRVKVTDHQGKPKINELGKAVLKTVEVKNRVKVDSIISREKDLALALKTRSIRIDTPVMGESLVGIEVPNPTPDLVMLRGVMESEDFTKLRDEANLPIALGKSTGGETVLVDLAKMPHLLIAGATGSGKSVCINTIVSCLIMEKSPAEMRLLLVDPKRVELTPYNGIPHLLTPVVVETDQVVALLKGLIREMMGRYRLMEERGVRNIDAYNSKMTEKMPYVVLAVDELADLMMSASFDVEQSLCRLAQLGRATGIHLIVATQRPSVDVVTGLIKANFPSRLSFGVASQIDSRTILDTVGAEKLLGRGDMLYLAVDSSRPERVQGVFISDTEIESLVKFWQTTPRAPVAEVLLNTVGDSDNDDRNSENGDGATDVRDKLMDSAVDLAQRYKKLSTSLLQRRLRIGYPRAARLMDQLEDEGIVGPGDGSKSRDVMMS